MVVSAEEDQVVEVGLAAVGPMNDVVDVAPSGRPSTAIGPAVTVSGNCSPPQGGRNNPCLAPDVENH